MRSLRRNLVLALSIGTAGLAAFAGWVSGRAIENRIRQNFDDALEAKAQALVTLTEQRGGVVKVEFADQAMPEFSVRRPQEYFEVRTASGQVVERSRSLGDEHLPSFPDARGEAVYRDGPLPDGRRGRFVAISFVPELEDDHDPWEQDSVATHPDATGELQRAQVVLARGTEELERLVTSIYVADLAVASGLALALALLVGWVVRRGLAPLDEVAQRVGALDEHTLGSRIELESPVIELEPIVRRLNLLLERLEGAFERERRFSGDAAHELRTPVTELRTLAEVGERWSGDADLARDLFRDAAQVAARMERSVEQMLALARAEGGREEIARETVDLAALLEACVAASAAGSAADEARATLDLDRSLVVRTDPEKLATVLRNLLDNALAHGPAGGSVGILTRRLAGGRFLLEVSNDAPLLEARDLQHLFERFWRKDAARSSPSHTGLGLALVRSLCGLLDCAVDAVLNEADRRLTLRLTGPLGADSPAQPPV